MAEKTELIPERKRNRLKNHNYGTTGVYFLTFCTRERRNQFWSRYERDSRGASKYELSREGEIVDQTINTIPQKYEDVKICGYMVMPDHVHLLLWIKPDEHGRRIESTSVSQIINQLKGQVTREIGKSVWQKGFYDHVVRNKNDFDECLKYIRENPAKWIFDHTIPE